MRVSILIVSWLQDRQWLEHCLRSIEKFARGFHETVVLVPEREVRQFSESVPLPEGVRWGWYDRVQERDRWHLHHQVMKCRADQFCPGADFILHTDSDCIFSEPVTPQDYFVDGPVMLMEQYSRLQGCPWQAVVEAVLQRPVAYEFMRRHPQVNPIGVYAALRKRLCQLHQQPFDDYVLSLKADHPWGFSEHNVIGAFAWYSPEWRGAYHWIDLAREPRPPSKLIQFWSHSPPDQPQDMPGGGRCVPAEVIAKLLA